MVLFLLMIALYSLTANYMLGGCGGLSETLWSTCFREGAGALLWVGGARHGHMLQMTLTLAGDRHQGIGMADWMASRISYLLIVSAFFLFHFLLGLFPLFFQLVLLLLVPLLLRSCTDCSELTTEYSVGIFSLSNKSPHTIHGNNLFYHVTL